MTLTRAELDAAPRELLSRGSRVKPAVFRVELPSGSSVVVKDVRDIPTLTRGLARFLMRRELRILRRLEGVEGVPQLHGTTLDQFD